MNGGRGAKLAEEITKGHVIDGVEVVVVVVVVIVVIDVTWSHVIREH